MIRVIRWSVSNAIIQIVILALLSQMLSGFVLRSHRSLALAAFVFTAAQVVTWPLIYRLAARFHPLLFPAMTFGITGLMVTTLTDLISGFGFAGIHVDGVATGLWIALGLTVGNTLLGVFFSLRDDDAYDWFVTRQLRQTYAHSAQSTEPGVLFLEIDGLAEPILRKAIADGWMPTIKRWLDSGSHQITGWEPDLSSQTSASQAGILLGHNAGIPAFRWYDKPSGTLMVSSRMATARTLEHHLSTGTGLLRNGASRWNVFSGDAPDTVCTYSTFGDRHHAGSTRYLAYFANPYTLPRVIALYLGDVIRERWQAFSQVRRNVLPRIHRTRKYAFVRAATTTAMQEIGLFMILSDVFRGVPAVYTTFFAYDEVAHHSGIDRIDAFKVLRTLDRVWAILERATMNAPRPYHLVILSDHGQSMGATFRQRYGQTLGQVVTSLVHPEARVTVDERSSEDWGHLNLALSEALHAGSDGRTAKLLKIALKSQTVGNAVTLGPTNAEMDRAIDHAADASDVVVVASGNVGLVSFPQWPTRLTYEQITEHFPHVIPGLIDHPGIGFVLVRSESEGGLVIGSDGIHYLDHRYAVGIDPLAIFGPHAADHLRRTDGFANAPDILVMSQFDPETEEVAAFEELVGSHGGLGGPQTQPFVLHPTVLDPGPNSIVGAETLHYVLKSWVPKTADGQES